MIAPLVRGSLKQPLFVFGATLLFILLGINAFRGLPVEAFPDVSDTQATIITLEPGRAAEEVEQQVTIPLEIALSGLPHAVRMNSHTQFGLSYIVLTFDDKLGDMAVRQYVAERLRDVDLPDGITPQLQPLSTAIGEIYRFRIAGHGRDSRDLRTIEDWVVERRLRQVAGVADVVTVGGRELQYEVNPDLRRLRDHGLTLAQLFAALQRANGNAGGGAVTQGDQQYLLRGLGLLRNLGDVGDVVIAEQNGIAVRVRDVAQVRRGAAPPQGIIGVNESDDDITGIVVMRKGENPSLVLDGVRAAVAELNRSILPPGVKLIPYYDRSWLIARTLHTVFHNLLEGALLVAAVLWLFLGNVRAALIVAGVIPLALLSTFISLDLLGIPANLLSLGAMDFGILVDGAVIVVENIFVHLLRRAPREDTRETVAQAAIDVGRPTLFSMLIIIAAHIPIFALQRQEGRLFAPMAYSVVAALIGSLIFSLSLVPLLSWLGLRKLPPAAPGEGEHEHDNRLLRWCKAAYEPRLRWALARPGTTLGIALAALLLAVLIGSRLGSEFLPELNEGTIWVNYTMPPSISVDEARDQLHRVRMRLLSVPEVETVVSKAGRPDDGTDPKLINSVEIFVSLKDEQQWRAGFDKERIIEALREQMEALPGVDASFSQPIRDNVLESISQVDGQIVVQISGDDLGVLAQKAAQMRGLFVRVPGVVHAEIDREGALPQYQLRIDRAQAARYGLNIADVQDVVETALGGREATQLYEGERHFGVVVRLRDEERELARLKDLLIATADGAYVPLSEVVQFQSVSGAMDISRVDGRRTMSIGVFLHGRDMGSVVKDMQAAVARGVAIPNGYSLHWSGEFENQQRAMKRLAVVVPVSIALIFVLLAQAFGAFAPAALILCNIPLALVGGIIGLYLRGMPLSVSAAIGFIALMGQAVLNGVVLVSHFKQLSAEGLAPELAVLRGALARLRTVLMTTLLAMLGLLPMALSTDIGSETQRPLATVVIFGLLSAAPLTLFVMPVLYLRLIGRRKSGVAAVSG
ncbi:cobalt-zinc-cadmium resistance protein CzcA [Solimonas aquatica]|uniref:Cobalt-zinc-cadmium resistance protein CzcA n=1 Tax=Solimonas aquatica TaxID=489703 RepID=A0A1H9EJB1_9GAMM|nr:CusA/CzcA family heavy metal efflux RND transporter [Solimonas aquatica]SEQ25647.1 cobalt-zinc-cadmium resistance protein CzcA [Solimonas aquatica]